MEIQVTYNGSRRLADVELPITKESVKTAFRKEFPDVPAMQTCEDMTFTYFSPRFNDFIEWIGTRPLPDLVKLEATLVGECKAVLYVLLSGFRSSFLVPVSFAGPRAAAPPPSSCCCC